MSIRRAHYQHSGQGRLKKRLAVLFGGLVVIAAAAAIRYMPGDEQAEAAAPTSAQSVSASRVPTSGKAQGPQTNTGSHDVVAVVNGQQITRGVLAQECLKHYGKKVLESLTNKYLIALACRDANIQITEEEVNKEIDNVARRFGIPVDQWLAMLERERDITADQYAREIIWPTIALKRLAASEIEVTQEEITKALQRQFGPQVHVRLIITPKEDLAVQLQRQATAQPELFPNLARKHSSDVNSASAGGLIQPIRQHSGDPKVEAAAFALDEGEVSQVLPVGDQFAILKCETHIAPKSPNDQELVQTERLIRDNIRDGKLRETSAGLFQKLQERAKLKNVFNDPTKRQAMPGVAAIINGQQITIAELADECFRRHGKEILEGQVNRALLNGALAEKNLNVTRQHIESEVTRAARAAGIITASGQAHPQKWVQMVTKQQDITEQIYFDDVVWPSVALKILVADQVQITAEEMHKAFEAHYGERVRCRAIVMNNQRRATEVFEMARHEATAENFAKLAEQYSIDPSGKAIGGEIPPIQRHGGQPALEKEAFSLRKGEISGLIELSGTGAEDQFIILFCEGRTKPVVVELDEVRDELHEDLLEKKFRIVMAGHFQQLRDSAHIQNYLNPEASNTPKKQTATLPAGQGRFAPRTDTTR